MRAVITFHALDLQPGPLSYSPEGLDALLGALSDAQIPVLDLDRLLLPETKRGVSLTFDDGLKSLHDAGVPILRAHRVPAHVFVVPGRLSKDNRWPGQPAAAQTYPMLNWTEIEAIQAAGVRIEGHTANHPDLRALDDAAILEELEEADAIIEARTGRRPTYFAYPYGYHSPRVQAIVRPRYRACFTTRLAYLSEGDDRAALPRLDSHYLRSPRLARRLATARVHRYLSLRGFVRRLRGTE